MELVKREQSVWSGFARELRAAVETKWQLDNEVHRIQDNLEGALSRLFANLLRVAAGGGRDYEINNQCVDVCVAAQEFYQREHHPRAMFEERLSWNAAIGSLRTWTNEEHFLKVFKELPRHSRAEHYAMNRILTGALRMVASDLLGQNSQHAQGSNELHAGLRDLEEAHEMARQEFYGTRERAQK